MNETQVRDALSQLVAGAPEFWTQLVAEYAARQEMRGLLAIAGAVAVLVLYAVVFALSRLIRDELRDTVRLVGGVAAAMVSVVWLRHGIGRLIEAAAPAVSLVESIR